MPARPPTLTGYSAFLASVVNVPSQAIPPQFTGSGTFQQGSDVLTIVSVTTGSVWDDAFLSDAEDAIPENTPVITQLSGTTGSVGTYELGAIATQTISTPEAITAANDWVVGSFKIALDLVNEGLSFVSDRLYEWAVYNLAADRLVNFAPDPPQVAFFVPLRVKLRLSAPVFGIVTGGSDQGTASSQITPKFVESLTMLDLQTLRTPWGRDYMGIAQQYGPTIWGLS